MGGRPGEERTRGVIVEMGTESMRPGGLRRRRPFGGRQAKGTGVGAAEGTMPAARGLVTAPFMTLEALVLVTRVAFVGLAGLMAVLLCPHGREDVGGRRNLQRCGFVCTPAFQPRQGLGHGRCERAQQDRVAGNPGGEPAEELDSDHVGFN